MMSIKDLHDDDLIDGIFIIYDVKDLIMCIL